VSDNKPPIGFDDTDLVIIRNSLAHSQRAWNKWVDEDSLPEPWDPPSARKLIKRMGEILSKFEFLGTPKEQKTDYPKVAQNEQ
jgi:hypothetical protein